MRNNPRATKSRVSRSSGTRNPVLAICGGGNAGHALAVVASQTFDGDVDWLVNADDKAEVLRDRVATEGLSSTGVISEHADKLRTISSDPAEVIPEADMVMIVVPAYAHTAVLERISPYLKETVLLGCLPARSGFEFDVLRLIPGIEPHGHRTVFGLQTLPWSTRVVTPGTVVNFGALKAKVLLASLPRHRASQISAELSLLLGLELIPTDSLLNLTLGNPGQFIHPGLMYGHFSSWSDTEYDAESIPLFYAQASDAIARPVEQLSSEASAVASEIEEHSGHALDLSGVLPVLEWLQISYPTQTVDKTTVGSCFRTGPLQHRKAPMREIGEGRFVPEFDYRYLTEDVPFGLVVTRAIAEIAGVTTPMIDEVITWTQERTGTSYLRDGRLDGADARHLPLPQNHGVSTLADLISLYVDDTEGA
jgi:hypothetical protein